MRRLGAAAGLLLAALTLLIVATPAAQPASAGGRPLRYLAGDVGTLDPAFISDASDVQLLLQHAGLTRIDEEGSVYASLADGWEISDEGRTYTFHLREGLRFSDGTPLTAADVRRSWLRILDPATGALAPDVLTIIEGAAAWRARAARRTTSASRRRTTRRWSSTWSMRPATFRRWWPPRPRSSSRLR